MSENNPSIQEPIETESAFLDSFLNEFKKFNEGIADQSSGEKLYSYLFQHGSRLLVSFCKTGKTFLEELDKTSEITETDHYLVHFSYPDRFKSILMLMRDVLLQLSIAQLRASESLVSKTLIEEHFQKSQTLLNTELEKALSYFAQERKALLEKPGKEN